MLSDRTQGDSPHLPDVVPGALPLVGHGLRFARNRLALLEEAARRGPGAVLRVPDPVIVLTEPEDVQHVLVRDPAGYSKGPKLASERGARIFGAGLLTRHGAEHRRLRLLIQPAFHALAVERLQLVLRLAVMARLDAWRDGTVAVHDDLMAAARLAIQRVLFGELADAAAVDEAIAARRAFAQRWFSSVNPRPEWAPSAVNRQFRRLEPWLTRRVGELVDERLERPGAFDDLLALLTESRDRDGDRLTRAELVTEALSLTIPGHETTGEALAWTLDLLARNPHEQERARAAARAGDRAALERVADESLRLYPPTWITVRVAVAADTLPSGITVSAKQRLYVAPWLLHHDPRWWPKPERFVPDRFLGGAEAERPRRSFLPFGAGPRVCIGERLARAEIVEGLSLVLGRWRLTPAGPPPTPDPGLTLSPSGGVPLTLEAL